MVTWGPEKLLLVSESRFPFSHSVHPSPSGSSLESLVVGHCMCRITTWWDGGNSSRRVLSNVNGAEMLCGGIGLSTS